MTIKRTTDLVKLAIAAVALSLVMAETTRAALITTYASNPTGNSTDWTNAITGLGGTINSNVNFNSHAVGALNNSQYTVSDGVTFSTTGSFLGVSSTAGPGQSTTTGTTSPGEGVHGVSNTLLGQTNANTTFTVSFAQPVLGAGLSTIDFFGNGTPLNLKAYDAVDGAAGTGTLLGTATAQDLNFQPNGIYFLGASGTTNIIRSIEVTHGGATSGNQIGYDDIVFATATTAVPEPSSLALCALGAFGLMIRRRRRRQAKSKA